MGRQPQTRAARALAIGRKIAEIETEIKPLQAALAELKREHALLFGGPFEEDEDGEPPPDPPALKRKKTKAQTKQPPKEWTPLPARVQEYLATLDEDGASVDAIAEALEHPNRQTLRATLVALCKQGKIVRVGRGEYASSVTTIRPALVLQR
jgi:hypothetical protein